MMELSQLDLRLSAMEKRLTRIENGLGIGAPPSIAAAPTEPVMQAPGKTAMMSGPQALDLSDDSSTSGYEPGTGNWLGIIVAIACFVLAAAFIIKLSIDSGWLTPARQVGLATLLGFGQIGSGFLLLGLDRGYASLLPGAGIIVLYLSVFASHRYYSLTSFELALVLSGLVSALCIGIYIKIRHDLYPVTAAVGVYVAPVVLGFDATAIFSLYYFIICSLSFVIISTWTQSRLLTMISAYLAILVSGMIGMGLHEDALTAAALVTQFLIFSVGTYFYTTYHNQPLAEKESWCFLPVLLMFYAMEYYFIDRLHHGMAPWFSLGFAGVLISLYMLVKPLFPAGSLNSHPLLIAFTTIVCFHSIYIELLPSDLRPWLFVLIMLAISFLPAGALSWHEKRYWRTPFIALLAILAIEYITMIFHLLGGYSDLWIIVSLASLVSLWSVLAKKNILLPAREEYGCALLAAAHLLAVSALYRLTEDHGSLAISVAWLLYAVGVMIFAFLRKDNIMAKSALLVLSFAAAKALIFDAASAPTIVRIVCLLVTGIVLYEAGFLMRKISCWVR